MSRVGADGASNKPDGAILWKGGADQGTGPEIIHVGDAANGSSRARNQARNSPSEQPRVQARHKYVFDGCNQSLLMDACLVVTAELECLHIS